MQKLRFLHTLSYNKNFKLHFAKKIYLWVDSYCHIDCSGIIFKEIILLQIASILIWKLKIIHFAINFDVSQYNEYYAKRSW